MPGSLTTPGRMGTRAIVLMRVAFHNCNSVSTRNQKSYAAQWLAYALPYRRFACTLAGACARLGADAVRYSFIVVDFHHLLLAGFTGALRLKVLSCVPSAVLSTRRPPSLDWVPGESGSPTS